MLFIVSTPIGNLEDISLRAIKALKQAEMVLAEDTRKARILFARYEINKTALSFHDYNKKARVKKVLTLLKQGKNIALVSEAGTPGISDPGFFLIRACTKENIPFTAIPGANACINALILSGLPTDRFMFCGFLSPKKGRRRKELKELSLVKSTIVIFESRYRIFSAINDIKDYFRGKKMAVVREMTKVYEQVVRGDVDAFDSLIKNIPLKGEFVIVIDNR